MSVWPISSALRASSNVYGLLALSLEMALRLRARLDHSTRCTERKADEADEAVGGIPGSDWIGYGTLR